MRYKKLNAFRLFNLCYKYDKLPRKLKKRFKNINICTLFNPKKFKSLTQVKQEIWDKRGYGCVKPIFVSDLHQFKELFGLV